MIGRLGLLAVLLAALFLLLRRLLKRAMIHAGGRRSSRTGGGVPATGGKMVRDDVCMTYITLDNAISHRDAAGRLHYFCSEKCRSKYIDSGK